MADRVPATLFSSYAFSLDRLRLMADQGGCCYEECLLLMLMLMLLLSLHWKMHRHGSHFAISSLTHLSQVCQLSLTVLALTDHDNGTTTRHPAEPIRDSWYTVCSLIIRLRCIDIDRRLQTIAFFWENKFCRICRLLGLRACQHGVLLFQHRS